MPCTMTRLCAEIRIAILLSLLRCADSFFHRFGQPPAGKESGLVHDAEALFLHRAAHPGEDGDAGGMVGQITGDAVGHIVHPVEAADEHYKDAF